MHIVEMAERSVENPLPLLMSPTMVDTYACIFYRREYRLWEEVIFVVNAHIDQRSEQGDRRDMRPATKLHQVVKKKEKN